MKSYTDWFGCATNDAYASSWQVLSYMNMQFELIRIIWGLPRFVPKLGTIYYVFFTKIWNSISKKNFARNGHGYVVGGSVYFGHKSHESIEENIGIVHDYSQRFKFSDSKKLVMQPQKFCVWTSNKLPPIQVFHLLQFGFYIQCTAIKFTCFFFEPSHVLTCRATRFSTESNQIAEAKKV